MVVYFAVDKGVRKWLGIEKTEGASRYVNRFHLLGSLVLLGVFFVILTQNEGVGSGELVGSGHLYAVIALLIVSQLFDGYMHWKYHENPREYIITLIFLGLMIVLVTGILLVNILM
ncbi:DUF4181 domain-containing protein [Lentibacillus sp. JNUCC-1]|uniref:DUF4181 domain-containing protein n=1 Tax=Lentibacillus sp. JNUCC-1 TaxID=2654513 RepID=UPI0018D24C72|nr:DUF4181 domain-containing protein [Lentibacillus sp. JNUCC-1]